MLQKYRLVTVYQKKSVHFFLIFFSKKKANVTHNFFLQKNNNKKKTIIQNALREFWTMGNKFVRKKKAKSCEYVFEIYDPKLQLEKAFFIKTQDGVEVRRCKVHGYKCYNPDSFVLPRLPQCKLYVVKNLSKVESCFCEHHGNVPCFDALNYGCPVLEKPIPFLTTSSWALFLQLNQAEDFHFCFKIKGTLYDKQKGFEDIFHALDHFHLRKDPFVHNLLFTKLGNVTTKDDLKNLFVARFGEDFRFEIRGQIFRIFDQIAQIQYRLNIWCDIPNCVCGKRKNN